MDGMPWVAMAKVILDETQVVTLVGKRESARVTEHMRVDHISPARSPAAAMR
jgi:hypothetical protein